MINILMLTKSQEAILYWQGVLEAVRQANKASIQLKMYEQSVKKGLSTDKMFRPEEKLNIVALKLLKRLGFDMDELGTYLYGFAIAYTMCEIKDIFKWNSNTDKSSIIKALTEFDSYIYYSVSRENLELGVNKYHCFVLKAISKIDPNKANKRIINGIYKDAIEEIDYGRNIFLLASYLLGYGKTTARGKKGILPKIVNIPICNGKYKLDESLKRF